MKPIRELMKYPNGQPSKHAKMHPTINADIRQRGVKHEGREMTPDWVRLRNLKQVTTKWKPYYQLTTTYLHHGN